jgi:hypothetical protein
LSSTCFKHPSVHSQEDLYMQFMVFLSCIHISSLDDHHHHHHHRVLLLLVEHRASMKSFKALRSPSIPLTSFHNLPVFLISSSIVLQYPYIPKPYSGFPFHTKEVTFYIRLFTLHFSFFNNGIFKVCKLLAYSIRSQ